MPSTKQALLNYLDFLKTSGYLYLEGEAPATLAVAAVAATPPKPAAAPAGRPASPPKAAAAAPAPAMTPPAKPAPPPALPTTPLTPEERAVRSREAIARASACTACPLHKGRTQVVYNDGDAMARLMFVGEAPGEEEDRQGLPFVGRSGQLLTKMIEAIGFRREEVYICNTVKCRPPSNRDPLPAEKDACEHFLVEQIAIVRPQMIVALGSHAAQYLCKSVETIGRLRGVWHSYQGVPLRATYHPAFLLRSPNMKPQAWLDFQEIHRKYNELNPGDRRKIWTKGA